VALIIQAYAFDIMPVKSRRPVVKPAEFAVLYSWKVKTAGEQAGPGAEREWKTPN
jgi:hypothetical protein